MDRRVMETGEPVSAAGGAPRNPGGLEAEIARIADPDEVWRAFPQGLEAAEQFWKVSLDSPHLTSRMKELVLVAMHASSAQLDESGTRRHVERALIAGATGRDIMDVVTTIVVLANHSVYPAVSVLEQELSARGIEQVSLVGEEADSFESMKREFISARGFWNSDREAIARLMPEYYRALDAMGTVSWSSGSLTSLERELICIAIDCTISHFFESGLRRHIRNALDQGGTPDQIMSVFQLAGALGLDSFLLGAKSLFGAQEALRGREGGR